MRIIGLLVCVLGWFIAVLSTQVSGHPAQLIVALGGVLVAMFGSLVLINGAHLKNAIWKV
jgi:hypothetical protein